jgi:crotonobetainyl-CoA:carnitine CoA-transferase CaiB-like acyl-CoA transferase
MANNDVLQQKVIDWVGSMPRAQVLDILEKYEVVGSAVYDSADVTADPHFQERTLTQIAGTVLGPALVPGRILHVAGTPRPEYNGVPSVGEHTNHILSTTLGMPEADINELASAGIVASAP